MHIVIGTYRGPELVRRALESLKAHAHGWSSLTIVDDSTHPEWVEGYRALVVELPGGKSFRPQVVALNGQGYTRAMSSVCAAAGAESFLFWEEDFILLEDVDLREIDLLLEERPWLAQIVLQRNPVFSNEVAAGSMLEALKTRKPAATFRTDTISGLIIHDATFSCNPAVWQQGLALSGWPAGPWSEDKMTERILSSNREFAFMPGIQTEHDGERSGHGY